MGGEDANIGLSFCSAQQCCMRGCSKILYNIENSQPWGAERAPVEMAATCRCMPQSLLTFLPSATGTLHCSAYT